MGLVERVHDPGRAGCWRLLWLYPTPEPSPEPSPTDDAVQLLTSTIKGSERAMKPSQSSRQTPRHDRVNRLEDDIARIVEVARQGGVDGVKRGVLQRAHRQSGSTVDWGALIGIALSDRHLESAAGGRYRVPQA